MNFMLKMAIFIQTKVYDLKYFIIFAQIQFLLRWLASMSKYWYIFKIGYLTSGGLYSKLYRSVTKVMTGYLRTTKGTISVV